MPFTRPTTDVAKEGLFNILESNLNLEGISTLDIFSGTGSISYELASRGAAQLTLVEKDPKMYNFIKRNMEEWEIAGATVIREDVFSFLSHCAQTFDLIFAGPPYALSRIDDLPGLIRDYKLLNPKGWFVLEHTPDHNYEAEPLFKAKRNYGTTVFSIFVNS